MNDSEATRFMTTIADDPAGASALFLAVGDRQGDSAYRAVAEFARDRGFDLDAAGARRMHQALAQTQDADRDLADAELSGVDGGVLPGPTMPSPTSPVNSDPTGILGSVAAIGQAIDPSLNLFKGW